jgi:threonine dehydrogenase-like Zn-dependent dehydrogenase
MSNTDIPKQQRAVQLIGPGQLQINENKAVPEPGPDQVLGRVEVVGLCFSDLKLLNQFSAHARKSSVTGGIAPDLLREMPNYVPGDIPAVPGHEAVLRLVKVGANVKGHKPGDRCLVQTDYRWLPTANSNSAFGYNFEGALQEYVLLDQRVFTSPQGQSMLIPVPEDFSASALALVEPWACVEDAYVEKQRQTLKNGGRLLVIGETLVDKNRLWSLPGKPKTTTFSIAANMAELDNAAFDDVIYVGSNPATVEKLFPKVAPGGLLNLVQAGGKFGRPVVSQIGRIHYGGIRIIGTTGRDPAAAMASIPATAEIRPNDKINIIGAAGPMGAMHVIRNLCQGVSGVTVFAGDLNDDRLAALQKLAEPLAAKSNLTLRSYNPSKDKPPGPFNYIVLMAPVPALVVQAVQDAAPGAIINIFAGIPADKTAALDLDACVEKRLYFVGTSGSILDDMLRVLDKVVSRRLDTNLSVAAVSGLDGAIDGIRAVEKNLMPGKILVYPSCHGLKLTPLTELASALPLSGGRWNKQAEEALLRKFPTP